MGYYTHGQKCRQRVGREEGRGFMRLCASGLVLGFEEERVSLDAKCACVYPLAEIRGDGQGLISVLKSRSQEAAGFTF